jgi:hypothetical protein
MILRNIDVRNLDFENNNIVRQMIPLDKKKINLVNETISNINDFRIIKQYLFR